MLRISWTAPDPSEEECIAAVLEEGWNLSNINNQTPAICVAAVLAHPWTLEHVRDPALRAALEELIPRKEK